MILYPWFFTQKIAIEGVNLQRPRARASGESQGWVGMIGICSKQKTKETMGKPTVVGWYLQWDFYHEHTGILVNITDRLCKKTHT